MFLLLSMWSFITTRRWALLEKRPQAARRDCCKLQESLEIPHQSAENEPISGQQCSTFKNRISVIGSWTDANGKTGRGGAVLLALSTTSDNGELKMRNLTSKFAGLKSDIKVKCVSVCCCISYLSIINHLDFDLKQLLQTKRPSGERTILTWTLLTTLLSPWRLQSVTVTSTRTRVTSTWPCSWLRETSAEEFVTTVSTTRPDTTVSSVNRFTTSIQRETSETPTSARVSPDRLIRASL